MMNWPGLIEYYKEYLPVTEKTPKLSLHEGNTPLIYFDSLSEDLGIHLYGKVEGSNPTGSFKDRGMVMAVAKAKEEGSSTVICASTGNTSASAAAYAARAGMKAIIVIPKGKVALGKLAQAIMLGAEIVEIDGNFDHALEAVKKASEKLPITLVNSLNPYRLEGQKTASFEIIEQLGQKAPDYLCIPVGNAGNISAYWKGFKEYKAKNDISLPIIYGFEAEGSAAIAKNKVIEDPETVATAIRIGNPASWQLAENARDESKGIIEYVTDEEILKAHQLLPKTEGIFAEPGSCASIAGVIKKAKEGKFEKGSTVVAVLTGNGLKDPQTAIDHLDVDKKTLPNDEEKILSYIESTIK